MKSTSKTSIATAPSNLTAREILAVIPPHCFETHFFRSAAAASLSIILTFCCAFFGYQWLPVDWRYASLWITYAIVTGTVATGCWVIAHECGHRAFCQWRWLEDAIGYALHSALLVPYFSWRRSHALHHSRTNHLHEGETHVPPIADSPQGKRWILLRTYLGRRFFPALNILTRLIFGWPLYLLLGTTGGRLRGVTNHFWPLWPFSTTLFPQAWKLKVLASNIGVLVVLATLGTWTAMRGDLLPILLYGGPYLVVNAWLVLYTWLHHTDVDVPHLDAAEWTWARAVFLTVDRPYGPILDFLHHSIGSTHVVHHVCAKIPHYHAREATAALRASFPDLYRFDPTPIHESLWQTAKQCVVVSQSEAGWFYGKTKGSTTNAVDLGTISESEWRAAARNSATVKYRAKSSHLCHRDSNGIRHVADS